MFWTTAHQKSYNSEVDKFHENNKLLKLTKK